MHGKKSHSGKLGSLSQNTILLVVKKIHEICLKIEQLTILHDFYHI